MDTLSFRQGFRTVKLLRDDAIEGEKEVEFRFLLNGKQLYLKGTNWVPADAFHSRDRERIPKILELVWDVGCNALRVWGGGVYEDDCFYDWCDEKGIFLWQDFMMACRAVSQNRAHENPAGGGSPGGGAPPAPSRQPVPVGRGTTSATRLPNGRPKASWIPRTTS